ncbi:hypothetical protein MMC29_001290 [Sticta canariensis]|nr:hypothetical protein [Sticta canariensis]
MIAARDMDAVALLLQHTRQQDKSTLIWLLEEILTSLCKHCRPSQQGYTKVLQQLLACGVDLSARLKMFIGSQEKGSPLMIACKHGYEAGVLVFMAPNLRKQATKAFAAAMADVGRKPEKRMPSPAAMMADLKRTHPEVNAGISHRDEWEPLQIGPALSAYAWSMLWTRARSMLLAVDTQSRSPLMLAVLHGSQRIIEVLLQHSGDAMQEMLLMTDSQGARRKPTCRQL